MARWQAAKLHHGRIASRLRLSIICRVVGGSRTHTTPVHSRVPLPLWIRPHYPWQESNLHDLRLRRAACLRHTPGINLSTPARNRTWTCSFEASHDLRFTTRAHSLEKGTGLICRNGPTGASHK